jgi:hypothetical protein
MKRSIVVLFLAAIIVILDIKFIINILLNKKYVVDELSDIKSLVPLKKYGRNNSRRLFKWLLYIDC